MCDERIIRRFAGTFVLLSLALGYWVHPAWFLFTGFVGLNLLQSSFTALCPLERVLRRTRVLGCAPAARRFDR
jgi:hypothetical protein